MKDDTIEKILSYARRIAVVGLSSSPHRVSFGVAQAMQRQGYEIVPVNPNEDEVLGERAYAALEDVPGEIDVVNVFRRPEHLPDVAQQAVDVGARGIWNQLGLSSSEARRIAADAGLDYVENACIKVEVNRYERELELPPRAAA